MTIEQKKTKLMCVQWRSYVAASGRELYWLSYTPAVTLTIPQFASTSCFWPTSGRLQDDAVGPSVGGEPQTLSPRFFRRRRAVKMSRRCRSPTNWGTEVPLFNTRNSEPGSEGFDPIDAAESCLKRAPHAQSPENCNEWMNEKQTNKQREWILCYCTNVTSSRSTWRRSSL